VYGLLLVILALAVYLRFTGLNWGEYTYMHPDERFLVMVGSSIAPVQSVEEYFNTSLSSLNPHNKGYTFYVYGTFPLFLARYASEWIFGRGGLREVVDVGRPLSALFDLLTVLIVFMAGSKAYNRKVGLLGQPFILWRCCPFNFPIFIKKIPSSIFSHS